MLRPIRLVACLLYSSPLAVHCLKVLDVGAPRTGTQSLYEAFKILNMKALHSGYNCSSREASIDYLFHDGPIVPVMKMLEGVDVAMDEPFQLLYPEIMEWFPEAKFVFTMQESAEKWYASYERFVHDHFHIRTVVEGINTSILETSLSHLRGVRRHKRPRALDNIPVNTVPGFNLARYYNCVFEAPVQTAAMVQQCLDGYNAHNANVRRMIPPEKLLIFNMTDGWAPLCKFLDLPVPSDPFPFVDKFAVSPKEGQMVR